MSLVVFTIGHSTRPIESFVRLLKAHGVTRVIDVRAIPRSRHNPQYDRRHLSPALRRAAIHYRHMPGLGGRRPSKKGSINTGWSNSGFRAYADYMQTGAFAKSLERCIALATDEPTVFMCAEGVPWRCHRSLIADALIVRGIDAREISSGIRATAHRLTSFARVHGKTITYPSETGRVTR
ncbi:MAG TPA: DUF488 domain-containing protein [Vicinamibacterales bacterium]|nr:DUF488 domain-containing protein [Vicinamibacterales bacterium]